VSLVAWWRGRLFESRWLLWLLVFAVAGPMIANEVGWIAAEVGRQPWIVTGLLRTADAISPNVDAGQVAGSLVMFGLLYAGLLAVFIYLLNDKIQHGPESVDGHAEEGSLAEALHRHRGEGQ
jgi:cytochrome d ubiquinol oxidase subunit I